MARNPYEIEDYRQRSYELAKKLREEGEYKEEWFEFVEQKYSEWLHLYVEEYEKFERTGDFDHYELALLKEDAKEEFIEKLDGYNVAFQRIWIYVETVSEMEANAYA